MTEEEMIAEGVELVDGAHAGALVTTNADDTTAHVAVIAVDEEPRTIDIDDEQGTSDDN